MATIEQNSQRNFLERFCSVATQTLWETADESPTRMANRITSKMDVPMHCLLVTRGLVTMPSSPRSTNGVRPSVRFRGQRDSNLHIRQSLKD